MMQKVILTKGLPASGKTTWAKQYQTEHPEFKRVNKDDLRAMIDNGVWSKKNEEFVLSIRNQVILTALCAGNSIIVDDTNLHEKHIKAVQDIVDCYNDACKTIGDGKSAEIEIKDFTDVPLETCLERDRTRTASVGDKVILGMHSQYLSNQVKH